MPPKVKITREAILSAAIAMVRERGAAALNVRELSKALGCSVQPNVRNVESMDRRKAELMAHAAAFSRDAIAREAEDNGIPFLGTCLAYIEFANQERNLFGFLLQSEIWRDQNMFDGPGAEEDGAQLELISSMTGLGMQESRRLYHDTRLIVQGLALLVSTAPC
jgi:hypothetical protein